MYWPYITFVKVEAEIVHGYVPIHYTVNERHAWSLYSSYSLSRSWFVDVLGTTKTCEDLSALFYALSF